MRSAASRHDVGQGCRGVLRLADGAAAIRHEVDGLACAVCLLMVADASAEVNILIAGDDEESGDHEALGF